jgi:hypothetical protein
LRIFVLLMGALFVYPAISVAVCSSSNKNGDPPRFVAAKGEIFDKKTGLFWQRCSVGMTWKQGKGCTGERKFLALDAAAEAAKNAGVEWRVPTVDELNSIVDMSCGSPTIDTNYFSDIRPTIEGEGSYWTTSEVGMANLFYYIDFMKGLVDGHTRGFALAVRLVRTGK